MPGGHSCNTRARCPSAFVQCGAKSSHHIRPNCLQSEFRSLLLRKIENALTELLEYAAIMREAFHRANPYH